MATGDTFVSIQTKRILGFQDLRERFLEFVLKRLKDMQDLAFGDDGVFGGVPIAMSAYLATTRFELDNDQIGTDNDGHFLTTNAELAGRDIGIEFENTPATIYDVALHYAERPRGVQVNPRTGLPEFIAWEETIGERAEPNVVVDDADGTMTFTIDSVTNPFDGTAMTAAGRQCLVWKKTAGRSALTEPVAVEQLIVTWDGSNNKIATVGAFGQTTISTLLSDYYVLLLGPTVIRNSIKDLELEPTYEFIGQVTGHATVPTFDITAQNDLGAGYAIALNAITRTDSHGDLKLRVTADVSDTSEPQISVENSANVQTWSVDEDGDVDHETGSTDTYKSGAATVHASGSTETHQSGSSVIHETGATETHETGALLSLDGETRIGGTVGSDSDGAAMLGIGPAAATEYARRIGRVHTSWSHFREDFIGIDALVDLTAWEGVGSVSPAMQADALDGIIDLTTAVVSNTTSALLTLSANYHRTSGLVFETVLKLTGTTTVKFEAGFTTLSGATAFDAGQDGAYVKYDTGLGDSNWVLAGSDNGSITTSASSTAPSGAARVRLTIVVATDGSAELFVNGVREATIAAGSVGSTNGNMYFKARVETLTAATRTCSIDKMEAWQNMLI